MTEQTIAKKPKDPKVKSKKPKNGPAYEEALKAIKAYDAQLKEAGKNRVFDPPTVKSQMSYHNEIKVPFTTLGVLLCEGALVLNNIVPASAFAGVTAIVIVGAIPAGMYTLNAVEKCQKFLSPLKFKKTKREYELNVAFQALKEAEYEAIEAEILKKAKPHMKVIEQHIRSENRTLVYSGEMGSEGFSIQEPDLSTWEKELARVTVFKNKELESPSRKELTV